MKNLFLTQRFFLLFGAVMVLFLVAFPFGFLYLMARVVFGLAVIAVVADFILLFRKKTGIEAQRLTPKLLSLSDVNRVRLILKNKSGLKLKTSVIDELPFQLQRRDFMLAVSLDAGETQQLTYDVRPTERGAYQFGNLNVFAETQLGLVQRLFVCAAPVSVPTYPSVIQMRQFELKTKRRIAQQAGARKIRRLGHSYEFEQIKNYVPGDDFRTINWKASGRANALMVNQYEDERSQQVYCIIDKSRVMHAPFNELTLLDYAINTTLALSNIILRKKDKAGLISFSDKIGSAIAADDSTQQLPFILNALYKETPGRGEADYTILYRSVRQLVKTRSLLLLFTNFESENAMERVLPLLRLINRQHLLLVVFFKNTEIEDFEKSPAQTTDDIFTQTIARQYIDDKKLIFNKLQHYGIQTILTAPQDLTANTINRYLELKERGMA